MRSLIGPSTGSKVTSFVMPAAVIRPAFCRSAASYQREFHPLLRPHVEGVFNGDGPNPSGRAVRHPILTERGDMQVIGLSDLAQFVFWPRAHRGTRQKKIGAMKVFNVRRLLQLRSEIRPAFTDPVHLPSPVIGQIESHQANYDLSSSKPKSCLAFCTLVLGPRHHAVRNS